MTGGVAAPVVALDAIPRHGQPTLNDVAVLAGVSASTASRVLNGSARAVADPYRRRVEEAAIELGYTPNLLAQATARGSSANIALLVADIADPYFGQIAAGVARGAEEAGFVLTIAITDRDPDREARLIRALRGQRPRAMILAASRTSGDTSASRVREDLDSFVHGGGRVVALGPLGDCDARSVVVNNAHGARELGVAMSGLGYREAVVLAAPDGVYTSDDRVAGFTTGFAAAGGAVRKVYRDGFTRESGARLMRQALQDGIEAGTLVFAVSDVVAIGAMSAVREAGRAVGADVAICGFDDIPVGLDVSPRLTTVRVPLDYVGYLASKAAISEHWDEQDCTLPLEIVLRESTPSVVTAREEKDTC